MRCLTPACLLVMLLSGVKTTGAEPGDAFAANACVSCHSDVPGRSSEIVHLEWRQSVHFRAGVGCEGCHGGDAALRREQFSTDEEFKRASHLERSPEFLLMHRDTNFVSAARGRSVSYLCGKCHVKIKEQHLGSPHGEFGDPSCLYCHSSGSHRIGSASLGIIDTRERAQGGRCSACHRAGTMEAVGRIKSLLDETERRIVLSGKQYASLEKWGYHNLELERLHHHAAETRSQLRQIFHSFNMREISNFSAEIQAVADRTAAAHQLVERLKNTQRQQTAVGVMAVVLLLTFAGVLVYYKHTFLTHSTAVVTVPPRQSLPGATPPSDTTKGRGIVMTPDDEPTELELFWRRWGGFGTIHFFAAFLCLGFGSVLSYGGRFGAAGATWSAGHVLLMPLGPLFVESQKPMIFWPLLLANSAIWGLALALMVMLLKRYLRSPWAHR